MLKVVQWATGPVGRHALAAVVDHPDMEIAGVFVYTADKVGRDAGELCGFATAGVVATKDRDEILALDADCVLYMAQGEANPGAALDDICDLLATGKNVVSTAVTALIYPASMGLGVVDRLERACAEGGTSFHATGIEPGWASEVLPLTMSGVFRSVDTLLVQEVLDYSTYDNAFMLFDVLGFGRAPDARDVLGADPAVVGGVFRAPLMLVADGLGATIDEFVYDRQVWLAERPFDVSAGGIEAGTVAALRFSASAIVDGERALTVEHITRLQPDAAPDWPGGRGWKVTVEGVPSMVLEAKIAVNGEDENDQGCLGTAMHAVHAIAPVCAASPGIKTFLDLPTIMGRHVLRPASERIDHLAEARQHAEGG
jgi:2,4-diaminopentanoate dehydrogenase